MIRRLVFLILGCSLLWPADDVDFFERKIRPVLASKCQSCHGPEKQFAALRLDGREAILKGGLKGPAAMPGHPETSLLIKAVKHLGPKMPLGSKLAETEISALEEWVRAGMAWPTTVKPAASSFYDRLRKEHWAYQPVLRPAIPEGKSPNPVDRFLEQSRQAAGFSASPPAGKRGSMGIFDWDLADCSQR